MSVLPLIAVTMGDPAGIGPEVTLRACSDVNILHQCRPVVIGHLGLMSRVASMLRLPMPERFQSVGADIDISDFKPGLPQASCGKIAGACIDLAINGCLDGAYAGMVTSPICKEAVALAGIPYPGHTEWLAARCKVRGETMMMYHENMAVALVTCHQALMTVPASLNPDGIVNTARHLDRALRQLRGHAPRLAVCGFNPHAGENGLFGTEDRMVIPAIQELHRLGIDAEGPIPADTAFTPANRRHYHGWVCLYHDQGLIPFKALSFDEGVNVTLGLPIIRTSVDHGTAFDIAWRGTADSRSLIQAILLAVRLTPKSIRET